MNAQMTAKSFKIYLYSKVDVTSHVGVIKTYSPVKTRGKQLHPPWINSLPQRTESLRRDAYRKLTKKPARMSQLNRKCDKLQSEEKQRNVKIIFLIFFGFAAAC